jgi:tripartite-type tricarboxylate transporter receptor subunit TctC
MSSLKRMLFVALATALLSLALAQPSQGWPEHTVRLITSSPAGGSADMVARLFAERLSTSWRAVSLSKTVPGPTA